MRALYKLIGAVALGAACSDTLPPQGQVVLYLDTDAPVVSEVASGETSEREPAPLFDRVRVEIFPPAATAPCPECVREIPLSREKLAARSFSFGWVPPPRVTGYRVRLRMFRSAGRSDPRPASTIELVGYFPAVGEDGIAPLTATFHADDVGRPRGTLDAPIIFDRGAPVASAVGTWSGASIVPCAGDPPPAAACIPGGAFFAGDPRVTVTDAAVGGASEHLVVLSPFFLDAHEVTIGELRASKLVTLDSKGRSLDPTDDSDDDIAGNCDYTSAPGPNEDLPVDCVTWSLAQKYCASRGGDLPSEAELEVVASRRGAALEPWGTFDPTCDEAVVGRTTDRDAGGCGTIDPLTLGVRVLPGRAGSGSLDRVVVGGIEVLDLGANLSEWTRDAFASDDEPCWRDALLRDPVCAVDGRATRSAKGGNFAEIPPVYAQLRRRVAALDANDRYPEIGFRCRYPAGK